MTKEDEKLLLEDLGARMIHGVIVNTPNGNGYLGTINLTIFGHILGINIKSTKRENFPLDECKPYLRPMSSMTEYESEEYRNIDNKSYSCPLAYAHIPASERIDWLNRHHFDYRGLIPKDLAIEVTKENNPYA